MPSIRKTYSAPGPWELRLADRLADIAAKRDDPFHQARKRQSLASLRRGLVTRDGWHPAVAQVVDSLFPPESGSPDARIPLYQGGALFGAHPYSAELKPRKDKPERFVHQSLGSSLRTLMNVRASSRDRDSAAEREAFDGHFEALLNADADDLFLHLRRTIGRFQGTEVGVDWAQLMQDIRKWDDEQHAVQRRWARDWWAAPERSTDSNPERQGNEGSESTDEGVKQ